MPDKKFLYDRMERAARIGWCVVDLTSRTIRVSERMAILLEIEGGICDFDDYLARINSDYVHRIRTIFADWETGGLYNQAYPLLISTGYVWVQAQLEAPEEDTEGHRVAYGSIQILDAKYREQHIENVYKVQMCDLLQSQAYISQLMLRLLQDPHIDGIINEILSNIVEKFEADRSYIFTFDLNRRTHSCVYEVTKAGITSEMDDLQDYPMEASEWWCDQLLAGNKLVFDDIDVLREEHPMEYEVLISQDIVSLMVIPLLSAKGVWGYIGVDIVGHRRSWSPTEQDWFGSIANYISVCLELHSAVETTQRTSETIRSIYGNIPVGVELYDVNGQMIDMNDADAEIFGVTDRAALTGRDISTHPILLPSQITALRRGEEIEGNVDHIFTDSTRKFYDTYRKDRKNLFVRCKIIYGTDQKIAYYLLMINDNTDLLQAYKKMHETETLFESVSTFAEVGFCRLDVFNSEFFATDMWYRNQEMEPPLRGDKIFKRDMLLEVIHPDDRTEFLEKMHEIIASKRLSFKQDMRVRKGDGWKWLRSMNMVTDYDLTTGQLVITGLCINIDQTKRFEQNLIEAKLKAEESDRLKSAFLANMSHEIRTPLNAIVGFSSILNETQDAVERAEFISIIQQNNEHLLQLIADILDLSKIEAGVLEISLSEFDVNDMCTTAVSSLAMKTKSGVAMSFESGIPECTLYSDRNRLTQVLTNFLGNAVKFTDKGHITLGYAIRDGQIEFWVRDTGKGMTQEQTQTVFERFVKFNEFVQGTGLGLSICKLIAEKLGGQIGVESTLGEGSRFWIRLPYVISEGVHDVPALPHPKTDTAAIAKPENEPQTRKTILVAEDNDSNAVLLSSLLRSEYTILHARTGLEAVEMCRTHHPDLILMDVKMPGMDGLEATREIRRSGDRTPIIAITAFAYDSDCQRALEAGCTQYVSKPIIPETLRQIIRQYI